MFKLSLINLFYLKGQFEGRRWRKLNFSDFDTDAPDVEFEFVCTVLLVSNLFSAIEQQAKKRGVTVETLINLWLQQKLSEQSIQLSI